MKKKYIFTALTLVLLIIIIIKKNSFVPIKSYWLSQNEKYRETRTPSSITNKLILNNFKKYLDFNSYNNLINYQLKIMLQTKNITHHPSLKIEELIKTIDLENYKSNFKIIKALLKISHSNIILTFFPIYNSNINLNEELISSDVLILKNKIQNKTVKSLPQSIYDTTLPSPILNHEYRGGQIFYSPNDFENNSLLKFRLFVNSNQVLINFKAYADNFLKLNKLAGHLSQKDEDFFMTIDSIFKINNISNEIIAKQVFKFGVIENFNKDKIKTKEPFILGQYKFKGMWIDFKLAIKKISIKDLKIIKDETNLKITLITSKSQLPTDYITNEIENYINKNFRKTLSTSLRLQEFNE